MYVLYVCMYVLYVCIVCLYVCMYCMSCAERDSEGRKRVLFLHNVFSSYRMCSHTIECVLFLSTDLCGNNEGKKRVLHEHIL